MDYKEIKEIIKNVGESNLTFLELKTDEIYIKMQKGEISKEIINDDKNDIQENSILNENNDIENKNKDVEVLDENINDNLINQEEFIYIKSPIVGTFYESSSPNEEAFVSVGSRIKKGSTVCIIEAMKLMNEIEAEDDYEIVEVLAKNEQMVEYGQPLFKVKK